jgi:hypothetical protein
MSDKKILENICNEMASGQWDKHWQNGSYLIRPSGNPLTLEQNNQMRNNKDIVIEKEEMKKINSIEVYGNFATACFTVHQTFNYKGQENDDISVVLAVFKKEENSWKMITGSRSQGRSPNEPLPIF